MIILKSGGLDMEKIILAVFLVALLLNLYFGEKKNPPGSFTTKLLLMPLLLFFYLVKKGEPGILVVLALIFGFFGDLFLEWSGRKIFFLAGVLSFLAGHLFYASAFLQSIALFRLVPWWFYLLLLPYAVFGVWLYLSLASGSMQNRKAVGAYCFVILSTSFLALSRVWNVTGLAFWLPFAGSLLFIASDSLLAWNMFKVKIRHGSLFVMASYGLAQMLLAIGL